MTRADNARPRRKPELTGEQDAAVVRVGELIRAVFRRKASDHLPFSELRAAIQVPERALLWAIDRAHDLGLYNAGSRSRVWWVNPAVFAAGFRPREAGGQFHMRLNAPGTALLITGRHPGGHSGADGQPAYGAGDLGSTVDQLELLSARWLAEGRELFSLIARSWRAEPQHVWTEAGLHLHRVDLGVPVAKVFWRQNEPSSHLEFVTMGELGRAVSLVNVYPGHASTESEDGS